MGLLGSIFGKGKEQPTANSIRETLFGDRPLDEWPPANLDANEFPWIAFASARSHLAGGNQTAAIDCWEQIVGTPDLEPRQYLQAWHFLRQNGKEPAPDIAKQVLAGASVSYENAAGAPGSVASIKIGETVVESYSAKGLPAAEAKAKGDAFKKAVADTLKAAGYPAKADPARQNNVMIIIILTYLVILVTMVYGPIAAMLVELFPTKIRYTSMSLPYHIGNGWFGGLLPTTAFAIVAQTGNMYNGLWYPIIIASMTFVVGMLFVKETKDVDIYAND